MEFDDLQNLPGAGTNAEEGSSVEPAHPAGAFSPNPVNELVADLLETTGLVPPDRLAGSRASIVGIGRARAAPPRIALAPRGDAMRGGAARARSLRPHKR